MSVLKVLSILLLMAAGATGGAAMGGAFSSKKSTTDEGDAGSESASSPTGSSSSSSGSSSASPTGGASTSSSAAPAGSSTPGAAAAQATPTPPTWTKLTQETGFSTTYNADTKIGKEYGYWLVGTLGASNANQAWWTKKWEEYNADKTPASGTARQFSDEFGNNKVSSAFSAQTSATTALNQVCDSVYKKDKTTIQVTGTTPSAQSKLRDDLWKYCSPLGTRPELLNETPNGTTYTEQQFGKTKEGELLSTKENVNTKLWELKHDEFYGLTAVTDPFFKDLFTNKDTNKNTANSFKNKCQEAYGKSAPSSNDTEPSADVVVKYCSLKAMATAAAAG